MWRKVLLGTLIGIVAVLGGAYGYLSTRKPDMLPAQSVQVRMTADNIARGEYLFTVIADCDGCHSERDLTKFTAPAVAASRGRGWQFPKELGLPGDVVAPNITPDVETGIGAWTDGEKIRAIREGVGRDGRALFPMMPYALYAKMSDDDVQALVAYLNTIPAIRRKQPRTRLDFPVNYLIAGAPKPSRNVASPNQLNKVEWGQYLTTIGGCIGCHTPEDKGEMVPGMTFAGGQAFHINNMRAVSANITPDPDTGIGKMSEAEFIERFHQYRKYDEQGAPAVTPENFTIMPWLTFSRLSDEELKAIYAFLRTVKPVNHSVETHPTT